MNLQDIKSFKIGSSLVSSVYFGGVKVWPLITPGCNPYIIPIDYDTYTFDGSTLTLCDVDSRNVKSVVSAAAFAGQDDNYLTYPAPRLVINNDIQSLELSGDNFVRIMFTESTRVEIPNISSIKILGSSNITQVSFKGAKNLRYVYFSPETKVTVSVNGLFWGCEYLTSENIFLPDISSCSNISFMFEGCKSLINAPEFDTSNVTDARGLFEMCISLKSIPLYNMANVNRLTYTFMRCDELENIEGLTDLGKGFDVGDTTTLDLSYAEQLTRQSCINLFESIYNITSINVTGIINLHSTTLSNLSAEDKSIATNKGWIIQ